MKQFHEVSDWQVNFHVAIMAISGLTVFFSCWVFGIAGAWSAICYLVDKPYDLSLAVTGYAFAVFILAAIAGIANHWYIMNH